MKPRLFGDWVEAMASATPGRYVPLAFRRWSALTAVGAVLRRSAWYEHGDWQCRPNLYTCLVSPPAHGKGVALTAPYELVMDRLVQVISDSKEEVEDSKLVWGRYLELDKDIPMRMMGGKATYEDLCREMRNTRFTVDGVLNNKGELVEPIRTAAMLVKTSEFGVFMSRQDKNLQMLLTEGWDSSSRHEYRTKNAGKDLLYGPTITWMAAATPQQFVEHMPYDAAEQGLLSRIITVVKPDAPAIMEIKHEAFDLELIDKLAWDLAQISKIRGEFDFDEEAKSVVVPWLAGKQEPKPTDPMLAGYNSRRFSHLLKMSVCFSAARRNTRIITLQDWHDSYEMLLAAEENMPLLLRRFSMSESGKLADNLVEVVKAAGGRISIFQLRRAALRTARSASDVDSVVKILVDSKALTQNEDLIGMGSGL